MHEIVLYNNEEEALLRLLQAVLTELGYRVLTARTGREALNLATAGAVDAVILDYQMPEMTGDNVARELKRAWPEVPVIMFASMQYVPMLRLAYVDGFIAKGEGLDPLLSVLQKLILAPQPEKPPVRRFPRYSAQLPLTVVVDRAGALQMLHGATTTLGEGGLGGKIEGHLYPGELVLLQIYDTDMTPALEPRAQVRYQAEEMYGFEFLDLTPVQRVEVREFCQRMA
jgi:CheY-like chemotaxis protein